MTPPPRDAEGKERGQGGLGSLGEESRKKGRFRLRAVFCFAVIRSQ